VCGGVERKISKRFQYKKERDDVKDEQRARDATDAKQQERRGSERKLA
jgi:hypothetical protein